MGFVISEAPARIASFSGKEQSVRKDNDDGAALPPRLVSFVLVLAMDASNHEQELAALFPGIDFLIRAMAAAEDDAVAQDCKRHRPLGDVTVKLRDAQGVDVVSLVGAKTKGKPVARIAARAERVEVPVTIECSLTDDQFVAVARHYLGADLTASIASSQIDIADVIDARAVSYDDEEPTVPAKKTARRKSKVAVSLVGDESEQN
jgi:hypothetical protein